MRILVVEDEKRIASAIRKGLTARGYDVVMTHNGEEGFYLMNTESFDMVVLDIMLPSRDGLEILGAVRKLGNKIPVLILTAKDSVDDIVRGLDAGADGYLVKPFALSELQARIGSLLKRGTQDPNSVLVAEDLRIDVGNRTVTRAGVSIALTSREFALLEYLLKNKGSVVSREMLAREVWKLDHAQTPMENIIDVTVSRLRRKIDDPFASNLVRTVRGVGYAIRDYAA